jgi:hypothetical protein
MARIDKVCKLATCLPYRYLMHFLFRLPKLRLQMMYNQDMQRALHLLHPFIKLQLQKRPLDLEAVWPIILLQRIWV